ncbi:hypothetical protein [Micromonospora sp. NBC_01813]|uniref:hypothetical protein n=1 Tax=Micromonospora sp. NBC_01813 TaxID=2975988 RepID=UPI002DDAB5AD|nr:hypothetical protein [Micromonospora sp. NBC_01813]WSA07377.1 hypothetical protein OG958_24440 [Micromonospora sp. NBC_01813]
MARDRSEPADVIEGLLVRELRDAVAVAISGGADPDDVRADLDRRLRDIRRMQRSIEIPRTNP